MEKRISSHDSRRGNQIVNLKINIPKKLTDRQKELLKQFDEEGKKSSDSVDSPRPFSLEQAWKRLKDFMGTNEEKKQKVSESQ